MSNAINGPGQTPFIGREVDPASIGQTDTSNSSSGALGVSREIMPETVTESSSGTAPDLPKPGAVRDASYADASVRLSSLVLSPVNVQEIAKLIFENDLEGRKATRTERQANRDMNVALQTQAADKIRDQATFAFAAAVTMSAIAIVGAGVSVVGSVKAGKVGMEDVEGTTPTASTSRTRNGGVDLPTMEEPTPASTTATTTSIGGKNKLTDLPELTEDAPEPTTPARGNDKPSSKEKGKYTFSNEPSNASTAPETQSSGMTSGEKSNAAAKETATTALDDALQNSRIMQRNTRAQVIQTRYSAAANIVTEMGKIGGAALNYEAAQMEADKAVLLAEATKAQTRADDDTDFIKSYTDNLQAVLQKLSAIQESESDSMRQIVRG